jgi:hypothetical protein
MKVTVKKNGNVILERNDVVSVTDRFGAYELVYENGMAQAVYKDNDVVLELD